MYCGGQGIYLYDVTRRLAKMGHRIDVIVGPPYPSTMQWASVHRIDNFNLWGRRSSFASSPMPFNIFTPLNFYEMAVTGVGVFPEMFTFSVRAYLKIRQLMRACRFDIVHDVQSLGYGLLMIKALGLPVVSTVHHPLSIDKMIDLSRKLTFMEKFYALTFYPPFMQGFVARRLDAVITACRGGMESIIREQRVPRQQISVVGNGIDLSLFRPQPQILRGGIDVLFVGNTEDRKKGFGYLLKAMALLDDGLKLTVVDDGPPLKTSANGLIKRLGLESRVEFTGKVGSDELVRLYSSARVVAVPSLFEGFGLPAAEAMACGAPVVATTAGALPEVVEDGVDGLLVPPRSPLALAKGINRVLAEDGLSRSFSLAGAEKALRSFSWEHVADSTVSVYRRIQEKRFESK
jgi:glycosyltransferase involved in cell wall biosynthesis